MMTTKPQTEDTEHPAGTTASSDSLRDLPVNISPQPASEGSKSLARADDDVSVPAAFFADSDGHESPGSAPDAAAAAGEESAFAWSQEDAPSTAAENPAEPIQDKRVLAQCGSDIQDEDFVHPADRAEHLEQLPLDKQLCVLTHLPAEEAADALAELDEEDASDLLENMDADDAARLLSEMDTDDAVDILDEVEPDHREMLLNNLPADDAEELRMLLRFDPDTAAGVMNTDIITVPEDSTVDEAIQIIRTELEEKEMPYYVYVVDEKDTLKGVISLRELMLAKKALSYRR